SKAMKNRSGSPPVHVHVSDATPVHVHVKSQRTAPGRTPQVNVENSRLRPTAKVQTRVPWIPPGKASYKWEGPTQSLEITPPLPEPEPERSQSVLHVSDLTSEEEEVLQGRISHYERKIESLMSEVSSLRTELAHQKDLLLKKLETFEATNRTLRQLLREQMESIGLSEQKEVLLKRLADTEAEKAKLQEKDRELHQLSNLLDSEKQVNAKSSADLSRTLESTRAHLQGQLRSKEAENNRLSVQIKNLERAANQQRAEMDHVTEQLNRLKQEALEDREALKRATKAQKHRAARSEDAAGQLSVQLLQMQEKQVDEALAAAEVWQRRHAEEAKEKGQLEMELSLLNRISELSEQLQSVQERGRSEREALLDRLHGVTAENAAAKLENQNLKASASAAEEKLSLSQSELQQVKATIRQYEALLDSYKIQQVGKTRAEAEQCSSQVAQAEREAQSVKEELEKEIEEVRRELLGRLSDLEALPESLRRCQLQLQDAQDQERLLERRNVELSTNLTELRLKMETQGHQMDLLRQKNKVLMEENQQLQLRAESLDKLEEVSSQNSDLLTVISKRNKTIRSNQLSLEEKTRECSLLSRKLEAALDDARQQQISETRERAMTKERSTKSKILELETQLSRTASEIDQLRRHKEESQAERRYQSRLQDLKDRLEQSDSTNRSLQNYVQFLKASYTDAFSDVALAGSLRAPSPL
uniref:Outer dense fiber protein 2 n=1 Tax=Cyprinodon variegatus TaxID=28743 RepID=A0A3Q2GE98_CYPVA